MAALLAFPVVHALGQCLVLQARAAAFGHDSERMATSDPMPCPDCSIGCYRNSLERAGTVLPGVKPWFFFALIASSRLIPLASPRSIPIPRHLPLPVRPRALEFCVLRL